MNNELTDDGMVINFIKHPRNSVLGASLFLEGLFPELSKQIINEMAPLAAQEFQEVWEKGHEEGFLKGKASEIY